MGVVAFRAPRPSARRAEPAGVNRSRSAVLELSQGLRGARNQLEEESRCGRIPEESRGLDEARHVGQKALPLPVQRQEEAASPTARLHRVDLPDSAVDLGPEREGWSAGCADRAQGFGDGAQEVPEEGVEHRVLGLLGRVIGGPVLRIRRAGDRGLRGAWGGPRDPCGQRQELDDCRDMLARELTVVKVRALAAPLDSVHPNGVPPPSALGADPKEARGRRFDRAILGGEEMPMLKPLDRDHGSRRTARTRRPTQWRGTRMRAEVAQGFATFSTTS